MYTDFNEYMKGGESKDGKGFVGRGDYNTLYRSREGNNIRISMEEQDNSIGFISSDGKKVI